MQKIKYFLVYLLPLSVYFSFNTQGWMTFFPMFLFFFLLPLIELMIKPDNVNLEKRKAEDEKNRSFYDWILYLTVPVQVGFLIYFIVIIKQTPAYTVEFFGKISSMGLMCGIIGINVGHELGHRLSRTQQFLGEILLLSSLDTHFLPYHNGGHHRNVATPKDSATATKNQLLFSFWITSHFGSYIEAWKLENNKLRKQGKSIMSFSNRMVGYSVANVILIVLIYYFFGATVLVAFCLAAIQGILLLETVNYIEHYGLLRKQSDTGIYEQVRHIHSWNSDHPLGRLFLFNLSRHSDHHYNGSKKYQILESVEESPQMPTGYPGMMLLAFFQPFWFWVMNKELSNLQKQQEI
jgi:alkane 1-monooxygenase